jgi:hypothetical protein
MTLTVVLTVVIVWFLASLAAALLVAKLIRGTREPGPADETGTDGVKSSLKKTA